MSEKRFFVETVAVWDKVITDKEKCYSYEDLDEIVALLNKQQSTIQSLKEENEKLRNIHLSIDLTYSYGYGRYLADVRVIDDE